MKNKVLVLILLFAIAIPQVVSAAWWNPFSWEIFSRLFDSKPVTSTKSLETESVAIFSGNKLAPATTTPDVANNQSENQIKKQTSSLKPTTKQPAQETTIKEQPTVLSTQTTSTTTSKVNNAELELLKQQNEILKGQLEAQQKIAQNTTPVPIYIPPAPEPTTVSLSNLRCYVDRGDPNQKETAQFEVIVTGTDWEYGQTLIVVGSDRGGGIEFTRNLESKLTFQVMNNRGASTFETTLGKIRIGSPRYIVPTHTFTNTIHIGDVCQ